MRCLQRLTAVVFSLFASLAAATPLTYNASDIWWDPNEAGWGLNLIHQGDTLFGTLFVYGSDGSARWYSASNLVTSGDGAQHDRPLVFTGQLHESTGPAFGGAFDPAAVTRRQVGTMTFELYNALYARVSYTVNGVSVSKGVQRYLFRTPNLAGNYVGYQVKPADSTGAAVNDAMSITIRQSGHAITMTTTGSASGTCNYIGSLAPYGQLADVPGTFNCADGRNGPIKLMEFDVTRDGFTARMTGNLLGSGFQGRFVGARTESGAIRGDGWRTDLWWVPTESGWGVNVIEEGDTLFTTFFLYGEGGQPKWYSTSMFFAGTSPNLDGSGRYTGTVYESTGPWFGAGSYDPAKVAMRAVGTATLEVIGNRTAWLDFDINGARGRKVLDRFTFRTNDPSGTYTGHLVPLANDRGVPSGATAFNIALSGATVTLNTQAAGGSCTFTAPFDARFQYGRQLLLSGSFSCSNGTRGNFGFNDFAVSYAGFTANYTIDGYVVGRLAGARTGTF